MDWQSILNFHDPFQFFTLLIDLNFGFLYLLNSLFVFFPCNGSSVYRHELEVCGKFSELELLVVQLHVFWTIVHGTLIFGPIKIQLL